MSSLAASDPLTVATWLTAIFTGILAAGAIVTAIFAILAFRKQSTEVGLLQKQAERDIDQRRRAQASRVFVWQEFEDDPEAVERSVIAAGAEVMTEDTCPNESAGKVWIIVEVHIRNTSKQPIYDLITRWRSGSAGWQEPVSTAVLLPGRSAVYARQVGVPAARNFDPAHFDAHVAFRDAAGLRWLQKPDGDLQEEDP